MHHVPGYLQEGDPEGWWEETFKSHVDSKPRGPEAISFDLSFPGFSNVYGIPEHATSLSLKPTVDLGEAPFLILSQSAFQQNLTFCSYTEHTSQFNHMSAEALTSCAVCRGQHDFRALQAVQFRCVRVYSGLTLRPVWLHSLHVGSQAGRDSGRLLVRTFSVAL